MIKIGKSKNGMAGVCGSASYAKVFLKWAEREEGDPPHAEDGDQGLIVRSLKVVEIYDGRGSHELTLPTGYYAMGSGACYAIGAFAMGATAEQAVQAAIRHDSCTRAPMMSLSMPRAKDRKKKT